MQSSKTERIESEPKAGSCFFRKQHAEQTFITDTARRRLILIPI